MYKNKRAQLKLKIKKMLDCSFLGLFFWLL